MKHYTITTYGCKEWLCRTGRIPGELVFYHARHNLTLADIKAAVVARYHLQPGDMVSARKSYDISHPRQLSMYLCKQLTPKSLPEIGRGHGGRDHTTVIHAIKQVEARRAASPEVDRAIIEISEALSRPRIVESEPELTPFERLLERVRNGAQIIDLPRPRLGEAVR